jgi:hypothetical protein
LRAGLRFRYLGERPAFDQASPEYQQFTARTIMGRPNPDYDPRRVIAQGYFILDAYVAYRWRFLEAAITIQNLLNSTWREAQLGNRSCTFNETFASANPNCSATSNLRAGVVDVHFTPGIPFNPQFTLKAFF